MKWILLAVVLSLGCGHSAARCARTRAQWTSVAVDLSYDLALDNWEDLSAALAERAGTDALRCALDDVTARLQWRHSEVMAARRAFVAGDQERLRRAVALRRILAAKH